VKIHEFRSQQEEFTRRSVARRQRMNGLVSLFQSGEITVQRFRHLTALLKAEHKTDCRESGVPVASEFRV
jgi:hypothetical protein